MPTDFESFSKLEYKSPIERVLDSIICNFQGKIIWVLLTARISFSEVQFGQEQECFVDALLFAQS